MLLSSNPNSLEPGFPILGVFRLKGHPKRDSGMIFSEDTFARQPERELRTREVQLGGVDSSVKGSRRQLAQTGVRLAQAGRCPSRGSFRLHGGHRRESQLH